MKAWKIAVATVLAVVLLCIPFIHCDALIAAPLRLSGLVGGGIDDGTYVVGDDFHSPLNAGDYIFGYAEIDSTLGSEETEEQKADTTKWETAMLEIMDWVTNDVDWLTGLYHSNCKRIAHYK